MDDDSNGIRYLKTAGEIMNTLIEEEGKGNITLPTRFGDGVTSPSLVESWATFGIPLVLLLGIRLGEVATEKDAIISSFKRIIRLARNEDMTLDLNESVIKLRRLCQAICVATETFLGRGGTQDLYSIRPILDRLSTAQQLRDSGPGLQNLVDAIKSRRFTGTIGDLVGVEATPQRSYLDKDAPLYRLRTPEWYQIFNHGMKANPSGGMMHALESLLKYTEYAKRLMNQIALCIRVYNQDHKTIEGKLTIAQIAEDICRLYGQATSPVVIRVPARAAAINSLLGFSALLDMLKAHVAEREFFISHQVKWHGQGADIVARSSSFWTDVKDMSENVEQWYGMGSDFKDISFNVLGVDNGIVFEVSRMNHNIALWKRWADRIKGSNCDFPYEFGDNAMPSEQNPVFPFGVNDPRPQHRGGDGGGFNTGPQPSARPSSSTGASGSGTQERQQQSQSEPRGPKKPTRSNLSLKNPPTPVMFSEDSLSADEDEQLVTSTNEWTYPNVDLAGRKMKAFKRMHLGKGDKEVVIILCINQGTSEDPCGAYDESLIPTTDASSLVTEWEILLRRTTVYLAAWAEGIIGA